MYSFNPLLQRQTRSAHTRGRQALLTYDQDSSSSSSTGQYQGPGQYYNPYSTSPPTGGFLWPPPGTMNPSVPRSVAALPYLQLHGYTPYGVPYGQGYGQPTYPYLPETSEPYEGPPGERFKDWRTQVLKEPKMFYIYISLFLVISFISYKIFVCRDYAFATWIMDGQYFRLQWMQYVVLNGLQT